MLQQTRVEAVKPYFERFLKEFPNIGELARAEEDRLLKAWEGLGYYNRVKNMKSLNLRTLFIKKVLFLIRKILWNLKNII